MDKNREQQLLELKIALPRFSRTALTARACKQHNARQRARAARLDDLYAEIETVSPQAHPAVLARVTVSFLCDLLEKRHPVLAGLRGEASSFGLWTLAKARMLDAISAAYPWLEEECERQRV